MMNENLTSHSKQSTQEEDINQKINNNIDDEEIYKIESIFIEQVKGTIIQSDIYGQINSNHKKKQQSQQLQRPATPVKQQECINNRTQTNQNYQLQQSSSNSSNASKKNISSRTYPVNSGNKQKKKRPLKLFTLEKDQLNKIYENQKYFENYEKNGNDLIDQKENNNNQKIQKNVGSQILSQKQKLGQQQEGEFLGQQGLNFRGIMLRIMFLPLFLTYLFLKSQKGIFKRITNFLPVRNMFQPQEIGKKLLRSIFFLLFLRKYRNNIRKKSGQFNNQQVINKEEQKQQIKVNQKHNKKLELVLDLDETLIYTTKKKMFDDQHKILVKKGDLQQVLYVKERPFLYKFLIQLSKSYHISVYSASFKEYAQEIIKIINQKANSEIIKELYCRDSCTFQEEGIKLSKSLKKINKKSENTIFIDNLLDNLANDSDNSFLIDTYKGESEDNCLFTYMHMLEGIQMQFDSQKNNLH
ncbi:HAD-like domain [Pseudocohnilembus persalinus]|uniref:Mitochondrial import inner membrane translocase subunit TIM50 n=1 Tax=Pseudocohnilembus persalinus TaxID=266149 RepID=A0A0V0QEP4_PSEPJ|nr:HAD-like domain [Pseudocohnilembus persalinus]|eukprot:KRX00616.1 HAD-like domain [Pseudocohnilembus persalinus]